MYESELGAWLNPHYVKAYERTALQSFYSDSPFPHAVLSDFLRPEVFANLLAHSHRVHLERSHLKGIAAKTDWYWGAFSHLEYLRFFLGKEMRRFLNQLIGTSLIIKPSAVPQFNIFRPQSPGLPVHTDFNENVSVVSLLQLSEMHSSGQGGELILYRQEGQSIIPQRTIEPVPNTFIIFQVSKSSYHGVADMTGNWTRRTITYDWLCENQVNSTIQTSTTSK